MRKLKNSRNIFLATVLLVFLVLFIFYLEKSSDFVLEVIASEQITVKEGLKLIVNCVDRSFELEKFQDGPFWILKNYIRADHGELGCGDSITYTTHGDYTFMDNLPVLVSRWLAPVSFALYAPGYDFNKTLEAVQYVRNCLPESELIKYYVTFHIYFNNDHMPKSVPLTEYEAVQYSFNCSAPAPYENVNRTEMYKTSQNLQYPINVGRNIARKSAITHFIMACDIELIPSPDFVNLFIDLVVRNSSILNGNRPKVFPLVVFEVDKSARIPETKTELQLMLKNKTAVPFHQQVCKSCHKVPNITEWIAADETDKLDVFSVGRRMYKFMYWEPFYVSDNEEPFFDERVTWEGQKNKRIQGFAMCLLDYEFHVLNNAFLTHSPGIKVFKRDPVREKYVRSMNKLISKQIIPEYQILYGKRKGCLP